MKKLLAFLLLGLASVIAAGCASTTREGMVRTERREEIVLAEPVTVSWMAGVGSRRMEVGAAVGRYTAEREDSWGVYYFGEGRPVWRSMGTIPATYYVGGIFLPKDEAAKLRIFHVFETERSSRASGQAVQAHVVQAAAAPPPGVSSGAAGAGTVIGYALVDAMLEASVGQLETLWHVEDPALAAKIRTSVRKLDR